MNALNGLSAWFTDLPTQIIETASLQAPDGVSARLREEWLAHASERSDWWHRLVFSVSCCRAVMAITADMCPQSEPGPALVAAVAVALPPRKPRAAATLAVTQFSPSLCAINITPLIDVMLVLMVTLILTVPLMTHAIRIELPASAPVAGTRPPMVDLSIEFDGAVFWNGREVHAQQLDELLTTAAQSRPQPEIRLDPDSHVKYDQVAKVMASVQRHHLERIGFVYQSSF